MPLRDWSSDGGPCEQEYFRELIEPHLKPGRIEYLGEVSHGEKVELLQNARATLFPIERSEEHTSELQSRRDLVCRLLLEKKKKKKHIKKNKTHNAMSQ